MKISKFLLASAMVASVTTMSVFAKSSSKTNGVKMEKLKLDSKWDKTFKLDESVSHKKVIFANHFGITLAADLYMPKEILKQVQNDRRIIKLPAIAVCGPFGAVKEQCSGLYAHEMAKRGYVAMAFDPSFCGESGGQPRYMNSPDMKDLQKRDFSSSTGIITKQKEVIIHAPLIQIWVGQQLLIPAC